MEGQVQPVKAVDWGWVGRAGVRNSLRPILLTCLAAALTKVAITGARWRGYRVVAIDQPLLVGTVLISLGLFLREARKIYHREILINTLSSPDKVEQIRSDWGSEVELNIARWMACPAAGDRDKLPKEWYGLEGISYQEMMAVVALFMREKGISDWKKIQLPTNYLSDWYGFTPREAGTLPGYLFPIAEAIIEAVGFQENLQDPDRVREMLDEAEWRGVDRSWLGEALTFLKSGQWPSLDDSISRWIDYQKSSLSHELVIEWSRTEYHLTPERDRDQCALNIARALKNLVSKKELIKTLSEIEGKIKTLSQKQMEEVVEISIEETDETFAIPVCVTALRLHQISKEAVGELSRDQIVQEFRSKYDNLSDRLLNDAFALLGREILEQ